MTRRETAGLFCLLLLLGAVRWLPELAGWLAFGAEDIPVLNLPVRAYFGDWLHHGLLVLWTPLLQTGFPLFAESQAGATYPLHWLHGSGLPHEPLLAWSIVLHLAWAGAGLFAWLRLLGLRREAAAVPAVAFAFSALLVVRHQHTNVLEALSWWPWLLYAAERLLAGRPRAALYLGLAAGLAACCGHVQYTLAGAGLAALYLVGRGLARRHRRWLPGAAAALILALGLAAAQYLPLLELSRNSQRAEGLAPGEETDQALAVQHLPLFVAPGFWGAPFADDYAGPALPWEFCAYLGVLPLLLAAIGIVRGGRLRWLGLALAIAGLWLSLGDAGGVWPLLQRLPGWSAMRVPARLLSLYGLGLLLLAGLGLEAICAGRVRWRLGLDVLGVLLVGLLVAAGFVAPGYLREYSASLAEPARLSLLVLAGLLLLSLLWLRLACAEVSPRWLRVGVGLVLLDLWLTGFALTPSARREPPPAPRAGRVAVAPGRAETLPDYRPMSNLRAGQANVYNMSPLTLRGTVALYDLVRVAPDPYAIGRVHRLLGVAEVGILSAGRPRLTTAPVLPLPMIWPVEQVVPRPRDVRLIVDGAVEPTRVAYADREVTVEPSERHGLGTVRERPGPNRALYDVECFAPTFWVVNEAAYPGQRVYIDLEPADLAQVNLAQSGLLTPPGKHLVRLVFDSLTVRLGRFISMLALLAVAALVVQRRE